MDTAKIRTCSHLLPDPGGEVVRELLDEVERLRAEVVRLTQANQGWHLRVSQLTTEATGYAEKMEELEEARSITASLTGQLEEMTLDRDMARKSLAELQQTWAENAPAVQYKKERDEAVATIAKATKECGNYCPFCGVDPRPQKQCRSCENDHLGSTCLRNGKHKDDCVGLKAMKRTELQSSPSVVA